MGSITYDGAVVGFDDRTLAHIQVAVIHRFNAGRPVLLSWLDALQIGDGRSSMWLTPSAPLHFKFTGSRSPVIDRAWLGLLEERAASGTGLVVCNEQGTLIRAEHQRRLSAG
jgi:hypothetical protein